ncbi:MAG TPA: EAL domain-containing protein [Solirubrobacteraceae bacterium]|jgi:diguanylate cyclase (GGDEF)-like protein/PAS domain S-box-containing protein|nr:EAL domain-containing protein [Solirubrobacteraceae bacterium]
MRESCRVLLIEDDEDDYLITRDLLAAQQRMRFDLDWCAAYEEALTEIQHHRHDAYLIDYRLGQRTGLELVREGFGSGPRAPVILLTGQDDYEIDLEASALGVADYVTKQALDSTVLERAIRYAISHNGALSDLASSRERYALATRAANDGIWDWDLANDQIYLSHRWHAILGLEEPVDAPLPDRWLELVHPDDALQLRAAIDSHLADRTAHLEFECRMRHADGTWLWILCRGLAIRDSDGTPTRMAGSIADITQRRVAEERLRHDALHDPLTGLPNRALLVDRLEQILQRSRRDPAAGCAVLFLDLDRFKLINDSFSHITGDQLLVAIAARLTAILRPGDTVARLGGDEFTLLLDNVNSEAQATTKAQEICDVLERPFRIADQQLFAQASVGICLTSPDIPVNDLLRNADIAMYDAKHRGGGTYAIFDESMHRRILARLTSESDLRRAVEHSAITVSYQPIVDLATGRLRSLEALARWPEGWATLTPGEFIPIAEECGLIGALGNHVLVTALSSLAIWRKAGLVSDETCVSVNISPRQLDDPALPDQILAALEQTGVPPHALKLEITESTLMHEPERISRIVSEVCAKGVGLHLDDFGTGYSSLTALLQFPVEALKIDRSFVNHSDDDDGMNDAIVRSTIALAHSLGLEVVAEGVETQAQLDALKQLGCECGQGYLLSRPQTAVATEALLGRWDDVLPGAAAVPTLGAPME